MSHALPLHCTAAAPIPSLAAHPLRKRLWKGAVAMGAVLCVLIAFDVHTRLTDPNPKLALGHDLLPSYAAGTLTRQGRPREMFDRNAVSTLELRIIREANLDIDGRYGPWLNPPFFAWAFAPLSMLPYRQAASVFLGINLALFLASLTLLMRMVADDAGAGAAPADSRTLDWRTLALVPLLILLPLPFWQVMGHQQNTFISLLLMVLAVGFWRTERLFTAGAVAGLLFFKPQLAAMFAMVLVIGAGWRALLGLAVTGSALLAFTLIAMPGCLTEFFTRLPPILHWLQMESPYNWGRQVTFQSFFRLLIQGQVRGETAWGVRLLWGGWCAAFGGLLIAAAWRFRIGTRDAVSRDRLIAAAIAVMPLVMPYFMDYDLLLLCIPPILLAGEWIRRPNHITSSDGWLVWAWVAFVLESHFNPGIAGHSRLNPMVVILVLIGLLHVLRCFRPYRPTNTLHRVQPAVAPSRRAATAVLEGPAEVVPAQTLVLTR